MKRSHLYHAGSLNFLIFLSAASLSAAQEKQDGASAPGMLHVWKGTIEIPGTALGFVVRFTTENASATGTIDIVAQNAIGLPLSDVELSKKKLRFTLPVGAPAVFDLDIADDGETAKGTMIQHGQTFPVTARLATGAEAASTGPPRPQTPKPPFPYKCEDVTFRNAKDVVTLAGTLTLPKRKGPHAAVVLITGSGPQDRDETILGHKPFLVIADHLTRRGIAVLRYDDRGVGQSKASADSIKATTTANLADDVRAAVAFLRARDDIDPNRIGLIGHSEGGAIAPMLAADDKDVACIVLLAGPGVSGRKVLAGQLEKIALLAGTPRDNVARQLKAQGEYMDLVVKQAGSEDIRKALRELVIVQFEAAGAQLDEAKIKSSVDAAMAGESPWMRYFIEYDPATSLRKVKCPVLAAERHARFAGVDRRQSSCH
ncbi:MAG: alpha/beta fold hydrolase [Planctomycetes bacterium]|nr:alpha/beta fold hydrolase [Planctomycetota bacterium]